MTTSAEMPDEIWASNLGGWWSHVTNAATTRYILADLYDAQAAEIAALKAVDAKVGAVLAEQDRDYAEKINRILERHAAQLVSQASEIAAHKLHIVKLYSKLENRAREFSPGDKS